MELLPKLKQLNKKTGTRLIARLQDETGFIELVWFKGHKWIKDSLKINTQYVIYGKLNHFKGMFSLFIQKWIF